MTRLALQIPHHHDLEDFHVIVFVEVRAIEVLPERCDSFMEVENCDSNSAPSAIQLHLNVSVPRQEM